MNDEQCAARLLDVVPRVMRVIRAEMRAVAKNELTIPQFRTLVLLSKQPATNKEVAEWLGIAAPTATRLLDTLVKRGVVTRAESSDDKDRRRVKVTLTAHGKATYDSIKARTRQRLSSYFCKLSPSRKAQLRLGLTILDTLTEGTVSPS